MRRKPKLRTTQVGTKRQIEFGLNRTMGSQEGGEIPFFPYEPAVQGYNSTERKYGKGLTYDSKYRPASSQSVDNYGSMDSGGGMNSVIGESWFLG